MLKDRAAAVQDSSCRARAPPVFRKPRLRPDVRFGHMDSMHRQYIAEQAGIFKALGHPSRLLMVDALREGEKCVCELQALVGDDMSTVSRHLAVLRAAGVVVSEKRGTNIYYRLAMCCLKTFLECTGAVVEKRVLSQMSLLGKR